MINRYGNAWERKMTYLLIWGMGLKEVMFHLGNNVWGEVHLFIVVSSSLPSWRSRKSPTQIFPLFCRGLNKHCQTLNASLVSLLFCPTVILDHLPWSLFLSPVGQNFDAGASQSHQKRGIHGIEVDTSTHQRIQTDLNHLGSSVEIFLILLLINLLFVRSGHHLKWWNNCKYFTWL